MDDPSDDELLSAAARCRGVRRLLPPAREAGRGLLRRAHARSGGRGGPDRRDVRGGARGPAPLRPRARAGGRVAVRDRAPPAEPLAGGPPRRGARAAPDGHGAPRARRRRAEAHRRARRARGVGCAGVGRPAAGRPARGGAGARDRRPRLRRDGRDGRYDAGRGAPARLARALGPARALEKGAVMNDFFADLEAQLRAAHGRRPSRIAHLPRPAAIAASLALVAGVAVAVAIALSGGDARQAARPETFTVPAEHVPAPLREHAVAVLNGTRTPGFAGRIAPSLLG